MTKEKIYNERTKERRRLKKKERQDQGEEERQKGCVNWRHSSQAAIVRTEDWLVWSLWTQ